MERTIDNSVLAILSAGRCDGTRYFLPPSQLERKMYQKVNDVLAALGGKWNRSAKAHVFGEPCEELLDGAIESGSYEKPQDMGWFPTPSKVAEKIAKMANIRFGMSVLEPSAGEGALVEQINKYDGIPTCVEIDGKRAATLEARYNIPVAVCDFLRSEMRQQFHRVLMNPPFAKRADIHHVLHARKFLKPGGKLVSIMSAGVAFREDKLARDFRELCTDIEPLPDGSFKESGTNVRTVAVMMDAA